jgi:hypothetical protein
VITAGLDVGRRHDRTALLVLDGLRLVDCLMLADMPLPAQCRAVGDRLRSCRHLRMVAVDATGLGQGAADQLAADGWPVLPVTIGAGAASHTRLFGRLREVINSGHFSVAPECPHRALIRDELRNLSGSYTPRGRVRVAARQGHDDLAFGLALAVLAWSIAHGTQTDAGAPGRDRQHPRG